MSVTPVRNGNGVHKNGKKEYSGAHMSTMANKAEPVAAHVVFIATHFRSHFRPMLFTAFSFANRFKHIIITIYVSDDMLPIIDEEILIYNGHDKRGGKTTLHDNQQTISTYYFEGRIRVVGLARHQSKSNRSSDWQERFDEVYTQLPWHLQQYCHTASSSSNDRLTPPQNGHPSEGAKNGNSETSSFTAQPTLLIFDLLLDIPTMLQDMAKGPGHDTFPDMHVMGWAQSPIAWALRRLIAPDIQQQLERLDAIPNASNEDIERVLMHTDGSVIKVEGSHECFDYELIPQHGSIEIHGRNMLAVYRAARHMRQTKGIIFSNAPEFEPGAALRLQKELGVPVFQIGAQFPMHWTEPFELDFEQVDDRQPESRSLSSKLDRPVHDFLDKVFHRLGPRRVLYISLGSVYSMEKRPDLVETLIETLWDINQGPAGVQLPFIFTTMITKDMLPQELRDRVQQADVGMFCDYAPQHFILRHPATGWFLTHGGSNSAHEAVFNGVPLVFWPVTSDQPIGAAQICLNLDSGIELIQVRTGASTSRPTVRGVQHEGGTTEAIKKELADTFNLLTSVHSSDLLGNDECKRRALEIRANVEKVGEQMRNSQRPGGECTLAMENLARYLG